MNFNDALKEATRLAQARLSELKEDVFLVRDLFGRIRVLLRKHRNPSSTFYPHIQALVADITQALGDYAYDADDLVMYREHFRAFQLPEVASSVVLAEQDGFKVRLHDRLITGAAWNATPLEEHTKPHRFTLFSMKGGVGRSTTTVVLARHLASKGKRVLVFDLDLESPGVGSTLLGSSMPRFGIVDWFVEDALGHGDRVLPDLVVESPLGLSTDGRIAVVPAFGSETDDYLSKLGRVTLERGPSGPEPWSSRLNRFVEAVEEAENPDVVLLDSRTGLHDSSASLVMAMGAHTLLFAIDTEQTWSAYRFLFRHWKTHPNLPDFRDKLWVVGAMIPDTNISEYTEGLQDNAWELFNHTLYDPAGLTPAAEAFAFSATDTVGNHYPRHVFWQRGLMAFDPLQSWTDQLITAAYQSFLDWFDAVLLEEPQETE